MDLETKLSSADPEVVLNGLDSIASELIAPYCTHQYIHVCTHSLPVRMHTQGGMGQA